MISSCYPDVPSAAISERRAAVDDNVSLCTQACSWYLVGCTTEVNERDSSTILGWVAYDFGSVELSAQNATGSLGAAGLLRRYLFAFHAVRLSGSDRMNLKKEVRAAAVPTPIQRAPKPSACSRHNSVLIHTACVCQS